MKVTLFSNDCPKCKILKSKIMVKKIDFDISKKFDEIKERGFTTLPILKIEYDDSVKYMKYYEACMWVNSQQHFYQRGYKKEPEVV